MNVLVVAAVPFFRERGTPIAVRLLCETLCEAGHSVDLLTCHLGDAISVPRLRILRTPRIPRVRDLPVGLSWRKLACDLVMSIQLMSLVSRNRYDVIHAVEEMVFPALLTRMLRRTTVIYDMDSSLADQILDRSRYVRLLGPVLYRFERLAVRRADRVIAVCDELAARVLSYAPEKPVTVLRDVPLEHLSEPGSVDSLRELCRIRGLMALYVGNLAQYQGIDLMLEGFARASPREPLSLVVVGGDDSDILHYRRVAHDLGVGDRVHFVGPRPIVHLRDYLAQASILFSPRLTGTNTPMKVYSYLAAGKPILATGISSHSQVLDASCAVLVDATPDHFARGIELLADDEPLRRTLGAAALERAASNYTLREFKNTLLGEYGRLT